MRSATTAIVLALAVFACAEGLAANVQAQATSAPFSKCPIELGTLMPDVGTYVQTTATSNFHIKPGDCLVSPNRNFIVFMSAETGDFALYRTSNFSKNLFHTNTKAASPGAGVLVQQDGHIVVYKAGGIESKNGDTIGKPEYAMWQSNKEATPFQPYFLIMEDAGVVSLYRGTDPANHLGLVWSTGSHNSTQYCVALKKGTTQDDVLARKTVMTNGAVLAAGQANQWLYEFNATNPPVKAIGIRVYPPSPCN